jgi:hypothetical protein
VTKLAGRELLGHAAATPPPHMDIHEGPNLAEIREAPLLGSRIRASDRGERNLRESINPTNQHPGTAWQNCREVAPSSYGFLSHSGAEAVHLVLASAVGTGCWSSAVLVTVAEFASSLIFFFGLFGRHVSLRF